MEGGGVMRAPFFLFFCGDCRALSDAVAEVLGFHVSLSPLFYTPAKNPNPKLTSGPHKRE